VSWKQRLEKYKYGLLAGLLMVVLLFGLQTAYRLWLPHQTQVAEGTAQDYLALKKEPHTKGGSWLRTLNGSIQEVQGDLLWNTDKQIGMMRLVNLPNPKPGYQYHIWAYDSHRATGEPLSMAILDRGSGQQEWFVPLTASESIPSPYKFELTLEPVDTQQTANPLVLLMVQF